MPTILQTMAEGLKARKTSRGTFIDIKYFITGCEGEQPWQRLLNALNNTPNLPKEGEELASGVFVLDVNGEPFGESDAIVTCQCGPQPSSGGGGPVVVATGQQFQWEIGTELEQGQTEFDREMLSRPYKDRIPIEVDYLRKGATRYEKGQTVTFNILLPRSTLIGRMRVRTTIEKVGQMSRRFAGAVNKSTWLGGPREAWLCLGISGTTTDSKVWDISARFAYDDVDYWQQTARWIDPLSGRPPALTAADLKNENGIIRRPVQKIEDFNAIRF